MGRLLSSCFDLPISIQIGYGAMENKAFLSALQTGIMQEREIFNNSESEVINVLQMKSLDVGINVENEFIQQREQVRHCWESFIIKGDDPLQMPQIRAVIAESWLRSKSFGVDPYANTMGIMLKEKEIELILKKNEILINTAIPFMTSMEKVLFPKGSGYVFVLADSQGVTLFNCGDPKMLNRADYNTMPGAIWSEETMGTCATAGCNIAKKPIQVNYCEHYNYGLRDISASAAPIFHEDGSLAGSLCIISVLNASHPHTLGMVTAVAWSIQNQLQLQVKNHNLNLSNAVLNATLATTKDGLLTIDLSGNIILANDIAVKLLNLDYKKIIGTHFEDILGTNHLIDRVLAEDRAIDDLEITLDNSQSKSNYLLSVHPIHNEEDSSIKGALISIQPSERVNKMVASRGGAVANVTFNNIIGESSLFIKTVSDAKAIANVPANVLIYGESGTGKELFAQAIHNASRQSGPFVAVNCAALPRSLIESELFGYEGGAFTGAEKRGRPGKIELAHEGTLFLDEIGDMPIELQPVLLRVLQDKQVMRLGGKNYIPVDFRVIAASNKNLVELVKENSFRADLYYRLSVLKLCLPPLRERKSDIPILANFFMQSICNKMNINVPEISSEAMEAIKNYSWPGNIRQLENAMVYATCMARGEKIHKNNLPEEVTAKPCFDLFEMTHSDIIPIRDIERAAIENAMAKTNNDTFAVSDLLGISRTTLYRRLKEYGYNV